MNKKIAVVTGGSSGRGLAISRKLKGMGMEAIIFDIQSPPMEEDKAIPRQKTLDSDVIYEILSVVDEIPEGCVATYGQIARLIGREKNARLVGRILSMSAFYGNYPCHRVVNHAGRLVPGWIDQRCLLEREGIGMKDKNHVRLREHQWKC